MNTKPAAPQVLLLVADISGYSAAASSFEHSRTPPRR